MRRSVGNRSQGFSPSVAVLAAFLLTAAGTSAAVVHRSELHAFRV